MIRSRPLKFDLTYALTIVLESNEVPLMCDLTRGLINVSKSNQVLFWTDILFFKDRYGVLRISILLKL